MAYEFYVSIEGQKQGKFKGESPRDAHKAKLPGVRFSYECVSPRDANTGQASGKRQHRPVTFTKEWGAASPQIFQALVTNEVLKTVLFEFVHTTPEGTEEVYHTVKLTNATVSGLQQFVGQSEEGSKGELYATRELETVSMTFQKIEIENKVGKTVAMDDWHN